MRKYFVALFLILVCAGACSFGQDEAPKYTFNIGGGFGVPQSSVSDFANIGGNFVIGAGANTPRGLGFNAEFMWQNLPPKNEIVALTGAPDGSARMYSVTGNLLFHTPESRKLGGYGIG